jgi:predicted nucleotidyltransferase component of viral defense system
MDWRVQHRQVMIQFLGFLYKHTNLFILKGGTSLMFCYGLDRFSEDIDFDAVNEEDIIKYVDAFCKYAGYTYNVNKDTKTVKRCMIHYGSTKVLKIETSYRTKSINRNAVCNINGITVYTIDKLMQLKCAAYQGRDKIRDLYDVVFIGLNYFNSLSDATITVLQSALSYKGLEQFDYLIKNQKDELIDNRVLLDNFLNLWDMLGLM